MEYLSIHKLKDWRYENEWRLIYDTGSWYFGPEDIPKDFWMHGKNIPFIRPDRIIMRMEISKQHKKRSVIFLKLLGFLQLKQFKQNVV